MLGFLEFFPSLSGIAYYHIGSYAHVRYLAPYLMRISGKFFGGISAAHLRKHPVASGLNGKMYELVDLF